MKMKINKSQGKWENGKTVPLILIGIVVVQSTLAFLISYIFQIRFGDGIIYSGIIIGYPCFFWFLISWIRSLRDCGSTLLDFGRPRVEPASILLAILLLPAAVLSLFDMSENGRGTIMGVFLLFIPVTTFIISSGRLQFVENGIWHHATLLKWKDITGYCWTGTENTQLMLQSGKTFFKGAGIPLPVPPEQKAVVNELLQKHLPAGS